jgi:hypothetical protein
MVALACPICRTRPPQRACGNRVFASANCPVCLETVEPVVALPCGHALCEACFGRIPGGPLLVNGQSVGAARPAEDARASEAQDRDATRQRHAEAEDAAARREAVERSRREAAEERERRAAVERSRREAERARAELRAARDEAARREAARARERDEAARREAARAREAAARERPSYNAAFAVNQRVEVRCRGGNQWFTGKIAAIRGDRLYDILYDDGESEARVAESLIRRWVSTPHTGAASARPMERGSADAAQDAYLRGVESLRLAAHRVQAAARERPPSHVFKGEWKPIWVGRWGHPGGRDLRTRETWFADGTGTWQTAGQSGTFSKVEPIEGEKGAYLVTCGPGDYEGCQIKRLTLDDNTCYWPEPKEYFTRICPVPPGTGGEVWESADGCACSIQ